MTVAADQRCCLQIWVVTEVIVEIAAEVFVEVAGGERVGIVDACWRYRRVLAWFSTWQICKEGSRRCQNLYKVAVGT